MKNVEKTVGAVVVGLSLISGCSSSSTSTPTPSQDGGTGQAGTPLTVWVFGDARPRAVPLADATIAWDGPGGAERVEVTSDAEGKAIVYGDFTKGTGTITVHAKGRVVVTGLDVSPENFQKLPHPAPLGKPKTDAVFILQWIDNTKDPSLVGTSGGFKNRTETGTAVNVGASPSGLGWEGPSTAPFELMVPKDQPHFIAGCEFKGVSGPPTIEAKILKCFRIDRPAQSAASQLDIDLSAQTALPMSVVTEKVEFPGGASGPFAGAIAVAYTRAFSSNLILGPILKTTPNGDVTDVQINYFQTDVGSDKVISAAVLDKQQEGSVSFRNEEGPPVEGRVWKDFLPITPVTVEKQKLTDPLPLEGFPSGPDTDLVVDLQSNTKSNWVLFRVGNVAPNGNAGAPVTMPKPPSSFTPPAVLQGKIVARRGFTPIGDGGFGYAKAISVSRTFQVER